MENFFFGQRETFDLGFMSRKKTSILQAATFTHFGLDFGLKVHLLEGNEEISCRGNPSLSRE